MLKNTLPINLSRFILLFILLCISCNYKEKDPIKDKFSKYNPNEKIKAAWDSLYEIHGDSLAYVSDVIIKVNGLDSAKEYDLLDSVQLLKVYRERDAYVQKKTNGKRYLRLMIAARPTTSEPYYWVQAIEDNGITYHIHFNFQVFDHPFRILLYDTEMDSAYEVH
jgi:hypothetical protein